MKRNKTIAAQSRKKQAASSRKRTKRAKQQAELERKRQLQIARKADGIFRNAYLGDFSQYLKDKQVDKDPKIKIDHQSDDEVEQYTYKFA